MSSPSSDEGSPNNPSSSSNFLHLTNSTDELGQSHLSSFSIRDYAFSNRTKNIDKSWPFSSTILQLCLKHALTDPLPPMQPLGSMVSHPPEASSSKKPHIALVEAISCKRKFAKLGSNQGFENGSLVSGLKYKVRVAEVNKNPRKKCGSVMKPGACVDSESKRDQGSLFSAFESRTCPICKTFSSASNTTLNAHMDKCLSVNSGQQPTSKPSKPRVKPRMKVKTMADIYAAAKACTLEDLDTRNGTKWAVTSSYSNQVVPEVCIKRKRVLRVQVDEDVAGTGPVYTDAKGQKLRIISKLNKKASDPSREHEEDVSEKKSTQEGKESYKSFRKRLRGKRYYKHCKDNAPRGLSHASVDLSETVSSPLRSCGERQVSGKITKGVMKLKKGRLYVSEDEEEDSGRWESGMTQERILTDCDDNEGTDKVFLSLKTSTSDYESWEETGTNNKGDDNMLDKTNDADAEFECMVGCESTELGGSTFMEVDPIPIPGPPGSFLHSPWDMGTDTTEHNGDFSVITSHVQSSMDQLDRNSSGSPVSAISNFAAHETQTFSLHNTTDKRTSGLIDNDQSCYCHRNEKAFEDTTFRQSAPHMIQQDLDLLSKSVPTAPSHSNPVLRLMGKDLIVL